MIRRLWRFLQGYVVLKVRGPKLERFLNRSAQAGVWVWDAERLSTGMMVARVSLGGFRKIRALCRGQGWRVSIAEKVGAPFALARLARRKALVAGGVLCFLALYVASGYVWFVAVAGEEGLPVARILEVAKGAGLAPGVPKSEIDRHEVQRRLLLDIDELSWAVVRLDGTRAVIEATLRMGLDPAATRPGDLVAARDGIVQRVTVLSGHAVVAPGDTVAKGDVLISGFIPPGEPAHHEMLAAGKAPYVRADGTVAARVWYEGQALVPLVQRRERPTGKSARAVEVEWGDRLFRVGKPPERWPAWRETRRSWRANGPLGAAFALHWVVYEEMERELVDVDRDEAEREARLAAQAQLEAELPPGAQVVDGPHYTVEIAMDQGLPVLVVTGRAEVVEEIATFNEIQF